MPIVQQLVALLYKPQKITGSLARKYNMITPLYHMVITYMVVVIKAVITTVQKQWEKELRRENNNVKIKQSRETTVQNRKKNGNENLQKN